MVGKIRDQILYSAASSNLFPQKPTLRLYSEVDICLHCGRKTTVQKTKTRTLNTLEIGTFKIKEYIYKCQNEGIIFTTNQLDKIVSPGCNFGYDVIVYVGLAIFVHSRSNQDIMRSLAAKNISISDRQISNLGRKFITYLAIAHDESREEIRSIMKRKGGYILHIDGTFEGDSPNLFCGLDGISELVLDAIKIPSEKKDYIVPFLKRIKKQYGDPIALVHDMGPGIMGAVAEVFQDIPDYICHFHFLRDIGKDLLLEDHQGIMKSLKKHKIRGALRQKLRYLENKIGENMVLINEFIAGEKKADSEKELFPEIAVYLIIQWVFEAPKESKGYGFPFDIPHLDFYNRLKKMYKELSNVLSNSNIENKKSLIKVCKLAKTVLDDRNLKINVKSIESKISVFNKLRESLRIADPHGEKGLNDEGDSDIKTIEDKVKKFNQWLKEDNDRAETYSKMIKQIEKYWDKLFTDPIVVSTSEGEFTIIPQRTNNILERFFRNEKRRGRKKQGCVSLNKTLKAILAKTPLIRNLENPEYLKILLNDCSSLAERFSKIDCKLVREQLDKAKKEQNKVAPEVKKLIRMPNFPQKISAALIDQGNI